MSNSTKDAPFKTKINGIQCITVIKPHCIHVSLDGFDKSFEIHYDTIRCIQYFKKYVLVNAQKRSRLVAYVIASPNTKKIHRVLLDALEQSILSSK